MTADESGREVRKDRRRPICWILMRPRSLIDPSHDGNSVPSKLSPWLVRGFQADKLRQLPGSWI